MSGVAAAVAAAGLAAASVAALVALPSAGQLRLRALAPRPARPTGDAFRRWWGVLLLVLACGLLLDPGLVAVGLVGAAGAGAAVRRRARRAAVVAERAAAVEACGVLSGELAAGRFPPDALRAAAGVARGPLAGALRAAAATAGLGGDVAAGLRSPPPGPATAVPEVLRALAACWSVCSSSGSGLAAAVARLEDGLRAEQAQRRAVDAELAGPRATAALLAVLPVFGLALAAGLGADPLHVLLHTRAGLVCLGLGLSLDALGVLWTARLVARAAAGA